MRRSTRTDHKAALMLFLLSALTLPGFGCSSNPPEEDTAVGSPDPAVKPAPAPAPAPEAGTPAKVEGASSAPAAVAPPAEPKP